MFIGQIQAPLHFRCKAKQIRCRHSSSQDLLTSLSMVETSRNSVDEVTSSIILLYPLLPANTLKGQQVVDTIHLLCCILTPSKVAVDKWIVMRSSKMRGARRAKVYFLLCLLLDLAAELCC